MPPLKGLYFILSSVLPIRLQNSNGYCPEQTSVYEKVRMSDHSATVRAYSELQVAKSKDEVQKPRQIPISD